MKFWCSYMINTDSVSYYDPYRHGGQQKKEEEKVADMELELDYRKWSTFFISLKKKANYEREKITFARSFNLKHQPIPRFCHQDAPKKRPAIHHIMEYVC